MKRTIALGILAACLLPASSAMAQGRGRGQGKSSGGNAVTASVSVGFGRDDRRIIVDWFSEPANLKGLPPGLAKKEHLPPGLQRQLAKNGHLPPGLEKQITPLPPVLEARLPRLAEGQKRIIVGGNVILMGGDVVLDFFAAF